MDSSQCVQAAQAHRYPVAHAHVLCGAATPARCQPPLVCGGCSGRSPRLSCTLYRLLYGRGLAQAADLPNKWGRAAARSEFWRTDKYIGRAASGEGQPNFNSQEEVTGLGVSSSLFLPILLSKNGELANTAHVVMEGVTGASIADFFHALCWGMQPRLRIFCHQQWIRRR